MQLMLSRTGRRQEELMIQEYWHFRLASKSEITVTLQGNKKPKVGQGLKVKICRHGRDRKRAHTSHFSAILVIL